MAKRVQITNQGLALLASSSQATGQYYWLGYYAPAYVPNIWKTTGNISFPDGDCGKVNIDGIPIEETDTDNVTSTMSMLTKYGDIVYNVWQGDLTGTGYANGTSDGSAGGELYGMTMYDMNVKKHYRYVIDNNGNNTLVTWIINPNATDGSMLGYHVYKGTDGFYQSTMPIPAPLYYLGDTLGRSTTQDYFINSPFFTDEYYNGATRYPYIEVTLTSLDTFNVPKVSIDHRRYNNSNGISIATPYPLTESIYFDYNSIPSGLLVQPSPAYDDTAWYTSDMVQKIAESEVYCTEFWKLHTISNYNRFHAPIDNIGHVLSTDLSNRNMSKSTKLFPISNYKVINTETGYTSNNQRVEVATAIKLSIDIDLSPNSLHQGMSGTSLNQNSDLGFFDSYKDADVGNSSDSKDQFGNDLYTTVHNSFKFNRIGIYAVPMRTSPIMSDNGFGYETQNDIARLQFQINPDEEPVLFAVVDWDNTVIMSDTGDGIHQFKADFDINLQSLAGVNDTSLIRDAAIFYNLYQDDAQTWYENQLIATASTSNAVTELGLEIANLKNTSSGSCCPPPDLSNQFASKDHTHSNFLVNLVDSSTKSNGGLRGINSVIEGTMIGSTTYELGLSSITLGVNTAVFGNNSIVASGDNNIILTGTTNSIIGAGKNNNINGSNDYSGILTGYGNLIYHYSDKSTVVGGESNCIYGTHNFIGNGFSNKIKSSTHQFIGSGNANEITGSGGAYNFVVAGTLNKIESYNTGSAGILGGFNNTITGTSSNYSLIGVGYTNVITSASHSAIISGQYNSILTVSDSFIGGGKYNKIDELAVDSFIGAGSNNYIKVVNSFIGGGNSNSIRSSSGNSFIGSGHGNIVNGTYSFIGSGYTNEANGNYGVIGGGVDNTININGTYSAILGGNDNIVDGSYSAILGGKGNRIPSNYISTFVIGSDITGTLRDSATYVNSLTLAGSTVYENYNYITMELKDITPITGHVLMVDKVISNNVAVVKWGPSNSGSGGIIYHALNNTTTNLTNINTNPNTVVYVFTGTGTGTVNLVNEILHPRGTVIYISVEYGYHLNINWANMTTTITGGCTTVAYLCSDDGKYSLVQSVSANNITNTLI